MIGYILSCVGVLISGYVANKYIKFYKMHNNALYTNERILATLMGHVLEFQDEDEEALDINIDKVLQKELNGFNECISPIEGDPSCACLKIYKRILIIVDRDKVRSNIIKFFGDRCPYPVIDAYISGLVAHERRHREQFRENKSLQYNATSGYIDLDKYKTDPMEIEATLDQYEVTKDVLSKYL